MRTRHGHLQDQKKNTLYYRIQNTETRKPARLSILVILHTSKYITNYPWSSSSRWIPVVTSITLAVRGDPGIVKLMK